MFKVEVFNTNTNSMKVVEFSARTWETLDATLSENGISTEGMRAVIAHSQTDLVQPGAAIPQQDFTLFLSPSKIKNGVNHTNVADFISAIIYEDRADEIYDHFSQKELEKLVKEHFGQTRSIPCRLREIADEVEETPVAVVANSREAELATMAAKILG